MIVQNIGDDGTADISFTVPRSELKATIKAIRPVIERTYPLAETADALRHLGEGHAVGKLVIVP